MVKNPLGNAGDIRDTGLILGSGRSPRGGHGNPLQYSCLENSWIEEPGGLSPWGCKESDMTEVTEHTSSQFTVFKKGVTLNVPESHPRGFCASDISAYLEFKSPNGKILRQGERQAV